MTQVWDNKASLLLLFAGRECTQIDYHGGIIPKKLWDN
eukprot:COSAG01_NODE_6223_length_3781_cov_8.767789_3_plen_38_part_00